MDNNVPHNSNIWIIITSKVWMGPVCTHNIFINNTLNSFPKLGFFQFTFIFPIKQVCNEKLSNTCEEYTSHEI